MFLLKAKLHPRKTVADFMALPEGTLAELIDGEILRSPTPFVNHQRVVVRLFRVLDAFVNQRKLGEVLVAPIDVHLPSGDVVEPDIVFISSANAGILQDWIRGVPDLVVEVLSTTRVERDRIVKRELYARNGVTEYWIVDPEARAVEVFTLAGDRYEPDGYVQADEVMESPLLPDLKFQVANLFPW